MNRISGIMTATIMSSMLLPALANAQSPAPGGPPPHIQWHIAVMLNGQQVDAFDAVTVVGQSRTMTHERDISHPVGCDGARTNATKLPRTLTVAPLGVDAKGEIGFAITAEETVEDAMPQSVRSDGCSLPPMTRSLTAKHPELDVPDGGSVSWTILKKDPELVYQLTATVRAAAADD